MPWFKDTVNLAVGLLVTYGKCHSHPTQSTDLVITHPPVVQMLCWISHWVPSCSWHKGDTGAISCVLGNLTEI